MTTEQNASTPDRNNDTKNNRSSSGSSGKLLFIAVIICIVAIIIYQVSKDKEPAPAKEIAQQESVSPPQAEQPQPAEAMMQDEAASAAEAAAPEGMALSKEVEEGLNLFLNDWKKAWTQSAGSNDNLNKFFTFYHDSFQAGNMDKKTWERSKAIRNQGKSWIEVWLSDIKIEPAAEKDQYTITFAQEYSSSNYSDKSTKMLIVLQENNEYKIIAEKTL